MKHTNLIIRSRIEKVASTMVQGTVQQGGSVNVLYI